MFDSLLGCFSEGDYKSIDDLSIDLWLKFENVGLSCSKTEVAFDCDDKE